MTSPEKDDGYTGAHHKTKISSYSPLEEKSFCSTRLGNTSIYICLDPERIISIQKSSLVYPGYNRELNQHVVVKYIDPKYLKLEENFPVELKILKSLSDIDYLFRFIDWTGDVKNGLYLVFEKTNMTYNDAVNSKYLEWEGVIRWLFQIGRNLKNIPEKIIVQGNIGPENFSIVAKGNHVNGGIESQAFHKLYYGMTMYRKCPSQFQTKIALAKSLLDSDRLETHAYAAADLIFRMTDQEILNVSEVLSHPLLWGWEKVKDFLHDVAQVLQTSASDNNVEEIRSQIDYEFKAYYKNLTQKSFNWKKTLDPEMKDFLVTCKSRPDIVRKYNGESIYMLIKLFRDKLYHFTDFKSVDKCFSVFL